MPKWDAGLQGLLQRGLITGYGLLDANTGACLTSCGKLSDELWFEEGNRPCALAQQLQELFHTSSAIDHFNVCCQKVIVVQRSEGSICAVSRGKQVGMTAHYLPSGILVTTFGKPNLPQVVVPQVEAACDLLRQP